MIQVAATRRRSGGIDRQFTFGSLLVIAALLALAKVVVVWSASDRSGGAESRLDGWFSRLASSRAEGEGGDPAAGDRFWPADLPEPAAGPEEDGGDPLGLASDEDSGPENFDPADLGPADLTAFRQLAKRRETLDEREQILDMRAVLIEGAEKELNAQIARLAELKAALEDILKEHDETELARINSLVKIYETMKPKAAADIFDRLEMEVLLEVVRRMREAKSAAILAKMNPAKAKQVTAELAKRREIPKL
jgi:flagellar motility protein MotE (MotC chaperone)